MRVTVAVIVLAAGIAALALIVSRGSVECGPGRAVGRVLLLYGCPQDRR